VVGGLEVEAVADEATGRTSANMESPRVAGHQNTRQTPMQVYVPPPGCGAWPPSRYLKSRGRTTLFTSEGLSSLTSPPVGELEQAPPRRHLWHDAGALRFPSMSTVSVVGVPSSAGSYAAGQDQAPTALRSAGLIEALREAGLEVRDEGDGGLQIWRPDRSNPRAQNVTQVTDSIHELIECLTPMFARGDKLLVLGGNCTVALGVVAALRRVTADPVGLLYVDRHYDLNTPESTNDGALDWMGMAHALDLPGCLDGLVEVLGQRPLLRPEQVAWLGVEDGLATEWERHQARHLGLHVTSSDDLSRDPTTSVVSSLGHLARGTVGGAYRRRCSGLH
jgi:arginase